MMILMMMITILMMMMIMMTIMMMIMMMKMMKDLYRDTRKYFLDSLPGPGELVAVRSDGGWQRALVTMDLEEDDSVEVFFVDRGVRGTVHLRSIRLLDTRFTSLPHQVIMMMIMQ